MRAVILATTLALSAVIDSGGAAEPVEVALAEGGRTRHAVVIGPGATERTKEAARDLAGYLERISGATFEVRVGDGTTGLAVGEVGDFPALDLDADFEPEDPFRRDDYLLRTHEDGAYLIGAGELAIHLAVWDFLHRLGYRLYFLTDTWEIVPERTDLAVALDTFEQPDYVTRQAPRGAPWSDLGLWNRWRLRNRVDASFSLQTGHVYGRIIQANREAFDENPDYYALVDGERKDGGANTKFCISNQGLRQLVIDWAVRETEDNPERDSLSMDPSDGGNWCECEDCAAMGSVSDLAITLANEVAEAINDLGLGSRYVGIYGYNQHSPPPNIEVHPNVVVSVATSFIRGGYTVEELVEGWRARGATLGIRDYHGVFTWNHDGPREARGGDLEYLRRTIPYFHGQGARFMNSENGDSWGADGLGFWMTPRMLWDLDEADRVDELVEDFLGKAFGSARKPMGEFYHLLNLDHDSVRSSEDVVARLYRHLDEARQLADDPAVRERLADLVLYTRYLELYYAYRQADGAARQAAFEQVWRHAYRMRDRMMLSTVAICHRGRAYRDPSVEVPAEAHWNVPEEENPWKSGEPFGEGEIAEVLEAGIEANQPTVLDFEQTAYSEDLVPATRLNLPEVEPGSRPDQFRGRQSFHTWLPADRGRIELQVTGGLIAHYRDRGNVEIALHADQEATLEPVARDDSVPPDGEERTVVLSTPYDGLHSLEWSDGNDMTRVVWPDGLPFTVRSTLEDQMNFVGRWSLYFYVPRGTRVVGGYSTGTQGKLLDGRGNTVFSFGDLGQADYFSVPVPEGQDGTLWKFENCSGRRMLMSVPPYLAPSAEDLLLPREVVEADAGP
ncbi:MAG: DUF4838 domain-containing protein [Verrucomicrobiales bacterium]